MKNLVRKVNRIINQLLRRFTKKELFFMYKINIIGMISNVLGVLLWASIGNKFMVIFSGVAGVYCWIIICIVINYLKEK